MATVTTHALVRPTWQRPAGPAFSPNLDALVSPDQSPPIQPLGLAQPGAASVVSNLPIQEVEQSVTSYRMPSFLDDYYHRIHLQPSRVDLGNIVSTQSLPVLVWNAYLVPQTLARIDGVEEGIQLGGQPSPPLLFKPLKQLQWQLSITPDGQPVLDTLLGWVFDNGDLAALRVTANRIIAWSFAPDWGDNITERLSFSTDVLQSESLVEQRRALLLGPRREFHAQMYAEGRERQLLDMALFGWGSRLWALPIWPDIQLLARPVPAGSRRIACSTAYLDFRASGLAMLRGEDAFTYEVVEIERLDTDGLDLVHGTQRPWPQGARLYPVRSAQLLEQPQLKRLTDTLQAAQVQFRVAEVSDWPAQMPATLYRGWPVLEQHPDETEDLSSSYRRLLAEWDSGMALPLMTDIAGRALAMIGYRWQGLGRAERAAYRSLIYALRGQQKALWIPTHADDLTLAAPVSETSVILDVAHIGYSRFGQVRPGRRDIRIEWPDGTALHRRITGSTELSSDTERLVIDSALGRAIGPGQAVRISWMSLCRSASDTVEIEHITDSEGVASSSLTFQGVRDDEF